MKTEFVPRTSNVLSSRRMVDPDNVLVRVPLARTGEKGSGASIEEPVRVKFHRSGGQVDSLQLSLRDFAPIGPVRVGSDGRFSHSGVTMPPSANIDGQSFSIQGRLDGTDVILEKLDVQTHKRNQDGFGDAPAIGKSISLTEPKKFIFDT